MAIVIITSLQLAIGIFYNTAITKAGQNCWPFRPSGLAEH